MHDRLPPPPADPLVLIVEDAPEQRESLREILTLQGFRAHTVATAQDAVPVIERLRPRAAIIDLGLPGMTGAELIRWLRGAFGPGPTIIVATGSVDTHAHDDARRAGADHILLKPLNLLQLRSALPGARGATGAAA